MSCNDMLSEATTLRLTFVRKLTTIEFRIDRYTFLDQESDDDSEESADEESDDDIELHIVIDGYIDASHHATVYRGKAGDVPLVVKTCHNQKFSKDFSDEAQIYETMLSELQGDIIPKLYGYFKGRDHENQRISCLVLEDCGDTLDTPFHLLEKTEKTKIMSLLGKLHQHGYHHGDFRRRNVVVQGDEYKLIDFHVMYPHECGWRDGMDWRTDQLYFEAACAFPCDVLFRIASDMHLWEYTNEPMIKVPGETIYGSEYPSQEVVDKLIADWYYNFDTNLEVLLAWLRKVKKEMDQNNGHLDIEAQLASRPELPVDPKFQRYDFNFRL